MAVSYKKLWKLLIDKDMKKKDLREAANLSPSLVAKMGRNENVTFKCCQGFVQHLNVTSVILWKWCQRKNKSQTTY